MKVFGKFGQAQRSSKLLLIFDRIQKVIKHSDPAAVYDLSRILALPLPESYDPVEFIMDLIYNEFKKEIEGAEQELLGSRADFKIKIRETLKALIPDLLDLQTVRDSYAENHPMLIVINYLQHGYTDALLALHSDNEEEKRSMILSKDLIGSAISDRILSVRSAKSRVYTHARLTKGV